jgi:hypothetical protein
MKKRFSIFDFKLFKYLRRLVGNEYPDSKSKSKKNKVVVEDNLRWQDDGGPVVEIAKPAEVDEKDLLKKE